MQIWESENMYYFSKYVHQHVDIYGFVFYENISLIFENRNVNLMVQHAIPSRSSTLLKVKNIRQFRKV